MRALQRRARDELERWKQNRDATFSNDQGLAGLIETIFELHLDIFCLIKQPNSGVDAGTVAAQSDRLQHWSGLGGKPCTYAQCPVRMLI